MGKCRVVTGIQAARGEVSVGNGRGMVYAIASE